MITQEQIFSEVKNTFRSYDEYGLIDDISLRDWMIPEIKRFGNNVMVNTNAILEVKNHKTKLPDDFWTLEEAWRYDISHYCASDKRIPIEYFRKFKKKNIPEKCACDENKFKKKKYISGTSSFYVYYTRPTLLVLGRQFDSKMISSNCINMPTMVKRRPGNEISINRRYIHTEFSEGSIYIEYKALPTDENGEVAVPTTQHDALYKYILRYLEYRVLRDLMLNNDDQNVVTKLNLLRQEKDEAFDMAMKEAKAGAFSPQSWKNVRNKNRRNQYRYEKIVPNINF